MAKLTAELIENAVNGMDTFGGIEFRSDYSGRGMYGKGCAAVEVQDLSHLVKFGMSLAFEIASGADTDHGPGSLDALEDAISDISDPLIDGMGRGYIVYWPGVSV